MGQSLDTRDILVALVKKLSEYNDDGMLEGYLNDLAIEFNYQLDSIEVDNILYYSTYPINVEYNEEGDEIVVTTCGGSEHVLTISNVDSVLESDDVLHNNSKMIQWVEEKYAKELSDYDFES